MSILQLLRVRIVALFVATTLLQPSFAVAGEDGWTDLAFPLWTLNSDGQFIIVDTQTGKYHLAPHQLPANVFPPPTSFAYDPVRDRIWFAFARYDSTSQTYGPPTISYVNPHTGELNPPVAYLSAQPNDYLYSLTYRHKDGMLYAFETFGEFFPHQMYVVTIDPDTLVKTFVVEIAPVSVDWHQQYRFDNQPPLNLVFDPLNDACYYQSSLSGDGGVLFRLDLRTGQSTVMAGIGDSVALAFEPVSHNLYGLYYNLAGSGSAVYLWYAPVIPSHLNGTSNLPAKNAGDSPNPVGVPSRRETSLAFVPHVVKE